jgi:putative protease
MSGLHSDCKRCDACLKPYGFAGKADGYPLKMKTLSLYAHLQEIHQLGIHSAVIRGRGQRPECIALTARVYSAAIHEFRNPAAEEMQVLQSVFSPYGYTSGYYKNEPSELSVNDAQPVNTAELEHVCAIARRSYESGQELPRVPVSFSLTVSPGGPVVLTAADSSGRAAAVSGAVPAETDAAVMTDSEIEAVLSKTTGTYYHAAQVDIVRQDGLYVPSSELAALRRDVLASLTQIRTAPPERTQNDFFPGFKRSVRREAPVWTVSVRHANQISPDLIDMKPALVYIPLAEIIERPDIIDDLQKNGIDTAAIVPRVAGDHQASLIWKQLRSVRAQGISQCLCGNIAHVIWALERSFTVRGDFGLNVLNSQSLRVLKYFSLRSATVSFSLPLRHIRAIDAVMPTEMIVYGRLPLMVMERCIMKDAKGDCACGNDSKLTAENGSAYHLHREFECRTGLYHSDKLFLADRADCFRSLGLWGCRLMFTTENAWECARIAGSYIQNETFKPNMFTRGFYEIDD